MRLYKIFKANISDSFFKNIKTLASGSIIAQIIPIALIPFITRLYTPEEMGILSMYTSLLSILIVFSTGKYEMAILIPKSDQDAYRLGLVSMLNLLIYTILIFVILLFFGSSIDRWAYERGLGNLYYLLPVGVLFFGLHQIFYFIENRSGKYRKLSFNKSISAGSVGILKLLFGFLNFRAFGLVFSTLLGQFISTIILATGTMRKLLYCIRQFNFSDFFALFKNYRSFPLFLMPSQAVSTIRLQLPVIAISSVYGNQILGQFSIAYQLIALPSVMIATSIGDVFRENSAVLFRKNGRFDHLLRSTVRMTLLIGIVPYILIFLLSPHIFSFILGDTWKTAGEYASILALSGFFQFVFTPIDKAAIVVEKTKYVLFWQLSMLGSHVIAILLAMHLNMDIKTYLYIFALVSAVHYIVDFFFQYHFSKNAKNEKRA